MDATWDLARVMRVPGTMNVKDPNDPRPVLLLSSDGPRYNVGHRGVRAGVLDGAGRKGSGRQRQIAPVTAATFTLDPNAKPSFEKLEC